MKLLSLLLPTTISAFQLSMNYGNNRSPLAQQYKSITSIHNSMLSGGVVGSGVRMAPPPGEPEPEVSFVLLFFLTCALFMCTFCNPLKGDGGVFIRVFLYTGESRILQ